MEIFLNGGQAGYRLWRLLGALGECGLVLRQCHPHRLIDNLVPAAWDWRARCNPAAGYVLFGAVAGIMVYISLDELLPTSRAYGKEHDSLFGLLAGMVVMALSLLCDGRTRTTIYWLL